MCHCLLIESGSRLILVDTGLGTLACRHRLRHLGLPFVGSTHPQVCEEETALARAAALGFSMKDVTDIVLTHLDPDHAGGLPDFPQAAVHVHAIEFEAAMRPATLRERLRYRASHFAHGPRWHVHGESGEKWEGFDAVRPLEIGGLNLLLVPLPGHTRGHCGVALETGSGWLLHAGDCGLHRNELDPALGSCPYTLRVAQWLIQYDGRLRLQNQQRLRELQRASDVKVFCSHDEVSFGELQNVVGRMPNVGTGLVSEG